ncbi:MAG TPA: hypothetical protein PLL94_12665 [Bacteroidales bacterium]|jgi:hypothetical protein|nr:hypothetical protein [Bacteroidales bacterium]HQK68985.1 hypothetical protein [Bacteroidales bacterium]
MQKLFTLIVIGGLTLTIFAQAPQRLSYQAVIRNSSGDLVINHSIGMRISILQGSASGTVVYAETHSATTNANGLATIEIGGGALVSGNFSIINWGSGTYFLKTETDPAGGISYSITGTSQLLSVPYALNSKMSDGVVDNSITSVKISDGAVTTADLGNNSITSGKISDGTIAGADLADNAVTSPKIFDGSVVTADLADNTISTTKLGNLAVSSDKLQNGAVISDKLANSAVTGAKIAQAGATTGQVLKWNSTTWAPANDETGGGITLPYSGSATPEDGAVFKITDDRTSGSVGPIPGEIISIGLHGVTRSTSGRAIVGEAIANSGNATGIVGTTNSPEGRGILGIGPTYGIYGEATSHDIDRTIGVSGTSHSSTGYGVYGKTSSATGKNYGVYGESISVSGYGVYGRASTATGTNYGVYGETVSPDGYAGYFKGRFYETGSTTGNTDLFYVTNTGTGRAIHAVAASNTPIYGSSTSGYAAVDGRNTSGIGVSGHSATNYGVYGHSDESYGVFGTSGLTGGRFEGVSTGVYGISTGTAGINFGVYGKTNSTAGYAGYFEGNVKVTGTLSKGGGSFEIDHPLDPANKILRHSFVESPDMMNVYNGNIRTDANGIAEVILPEYFEALNTDFRYQLTVIGEFAQAIIAEKISDNRFAIRTDKPGVEVSWQVTGIRKDPWAAENRIVVEEKKNQNLQGHYLYPELYDKPENRSIAQVE